MSDTPHYYDILSSDAYSSHALYLNINLHVFLVFNLRISLELEGIFQSLSLGNRLKYRYSLQRSKHSHSIYFTTLLIREVRCNIQIQKQFTARYFVSALIVDEHLSLRVAEVGFFCQGRLRNLLSYRSFPLHDGTE